MPEVFDWAAYLERIIEEAHRLRARKKSATLNVMFRWPKDRGGTEAHRLNVIEHEV